MSQVFRVLRCFNCKMYQVDILKKSRNWRCKICDEKQSVHCEIFRGTAADCRIKTQQMNFASGEETERKLDTIFSLQNQHVRSGCDCSSQNITTVAQIHHENNIEDYKQSSYSRFPDPYHEQNTMRRVTPDIHRMFPDPSPLQSLSGNTIANDFRSQEMLKRKEPPVAIENTAKRSKWDKYL